ncbi:MAG TPA: D-alanyl-D-alanine carboxypeptidase/D-alanyl-D-alanine-endopeptidase [Micrococcaceae bacterium]|jgi:D-alanyl-D-alanine carboxypeptidase/D-alanyl-D-alanine-endopeptidase (penicillin-binding protein 4)|nr:D-alanyl-D-alanine carboxypeptidase/D-alanyl-D-alanine-endopeptidase [Micrococcaceae bacterium]
MSRTSKILTTVLLTLVLAALAVPVGIYLAPVFSPAGAGQSAAAASLPASQQLPTALSTLKGIDPLSGNAPIPDPALLSQQLESTLVAQGGGDFTALVQDAASGQVLYSRNASAPRIPASNLKLLTAVAALKNLGAEKRLSTKVLSGADANSIVLQAGGDVLLGKDASQPGKTVGHAGVATLAAQTAAALKAAGVSGPVSISVDDTLFTGPALDQNWLPADVDAGEIAPVFPMALYGARLDPDVSVGPRPQDSPMSVAAVFAAQLKSDGVQVGSSVQRAKAGDGARTLAAVDSATVAEQVEYMLQASDNYVAETMGRLTALAMKKDGSFTGATAAVKETIGSLGVDTDGLVMGDSCGLAVNDRVSAEQLTRVVNVMLTNPSQDIRQAVLGLPIAGLSGTLGDRYIDRTTVGGAGLVRAKTGTLNAVLSLSGYVVDTDGRLLVFSFIGNDFSAGSEQAKPAIDKAATILAGCGCSG